MKYLFILLTVTMLIPGLTFGATTYNISAFGLDDPATDADAEQAYFDAITAQGWDTIFEDFTSSPWDGVRSSIVGGPRYATDISSQGLNWHTSEGDLITTTTDSESDSGWIVYSIGGSPQEHLHAVPDTLIIESEQTLYGIGGWIDGMWAGKGKIHFIFDDVLDLKFRTTVGFENDDPEEPIHETLRLGGQKNFYGVIVPEGFNKVQILEIDGELQDQIMMWSRDFTFATEMILPLPGDVNGDGVVDGFDVDPFVALLLNGPYDPAADMNNDGAVNGFDVDPFVQTVLGNGHPVEINIPEPATLTLLGIGIIGFRRSCRSSLP